MTCLKPLVRGKKKTTRQRGITLGWNVEAAENREGGNKGDIHSIALTIALAGDQVKESGRAPTDCSRKRGKNRQKKSREEDTKGKTQTEGDRKGVIKVQRQQRFHLTSNKPRPFSH